MKKLLALVLALVMTLGLATVGANAAYGDQDEVSFEEAVGVMSALGVFQGNEAGNFMPKANLDRASAAKLIAYLDQGKTLAESIPAEQKFDDVPATHWAAKYIAYCATEGYISGAGDGNFYPASELTGYAFGKMLLCVLGYDAKLEGYEGSDWTIAVAKQMNKLGLANGVTTAPSEVLTREEAAQYCLNALQKKTVKYNNGGMTITTGDVTITTGASAATENATTLADELYTNPVLTKTENSEDAFGRPATKWTYGTWTGTFADEATKSYTTAVTGKTLYTDLGLSATTHAAHIVDGTDPVNFDIVKNDTNSAVGGQGTLTEVYKNGNAVTIVEINTFVGVISDWEQANDDHGERVDVTELGVENPATFEDFETAGFAEADEGKTVVLYTLADGVLQTVAKAEKVENLSVKSYNATSVTVKPSTTYKLAAKFGLAADVDQNAIFTGTYTLYLDAAGNAIYVVKYAEDTAPSTDYVFVEKVQARKATTNSNLNGTDRWAKAVVTFVDGTHKTVDLKITKSGNAYNVVIPLATGNVLTHNLTADYEDGDAIDVGYWFAYTEKDGAYTLEKLSDTYARVADGVVLEKGKTERIGDYYSNAATQVVTIDSNYTVTVKTGLIEANLGNKVLYTYASGKKNISAFYAVGVAAPTQTTDTTYAYAVAEGDITADGTEWTFAINGAQVTKVVANNVNIAPKTVYDLTEENNVVTAATLKDFTETAKKVTAVEDTFFIANGQEYYFASNCATFNVKSSASPVGKTATLAQNDYASFIVVNNQVVVIYIVDAPAQG